MTQKVKLTMSISEDINTILTGQLDNLPHLPTNTVKLFLCANHDEFEEERKLVWQEILPDLQHHCCRQGIDVIIVDMLLGNKPDSTCSIQDLQARIAEINSCHEESMGPFFLCLVDDQYGDVPLPATLEESEYKCLCEAAKSKGKDVSLIKTWYQKNDNSCPPVYALCESFEQLRIKDPSWLCTYKQLLNVIQSAAKDCCVHDWSKNGLEKYFVSGLEKQVKEAMWLSTERSVFVIRNCIDHTNGFGINVNTAKETSTKVDRYREEIRIGRLKEDINRHVNVENIIELVCDESTKYKRNFGEYLDHFVGAVATRLRQMIDLAIKPSFLPERVGKSFDYGEALALSAP